MYLSNYCNRLLLYYIITVVLFYLTSTIININFVPGLEDKHYFISRALYDFLETHPEFDKTATYKVFKQVHMGSKHGKHFNFEYKDRSCHAYIEECIVNLNGLTQVIGLKIISNLK